MEPTLADMSDSTPPQRFGPRLRQIRKKQRYSSVSLAAAITDAGHPISGEAVRAWERGEYLPRRQHAEAVDTLLSADGELVKLAGYGDWSGMLATFVTDLNDRMDRVEEEVSRQGALLDELLARLPEPAPDARRRRSSQRSRQPTSQEK